MCGRPTIFGTALRLFAYGSITGCLELMNAANDDTRIGTCGRCFTPQSPPITSGPQLVTPICTGPVGVETIVGPPLSPAHAWISGVCCVRSCVQSIVDWIARG